MGDKQSFNKKQANSRGVYSASSTELSFLLAQITITFNYTVTIQSK